MKIRFCFAVWLHLRSKAIYRWVLHRHKRFYVAALLVVSIQIFEIDNLLRPIGAKELEWVLRNLNEPISIISLILMSLFGSLGVAYSVIAAKLLKRLV